MCDQDSSDKCVCVCVWASAALLHCFWRSWLNQQFR